MKALLLRIGIDKGTDGALAPIFGDGSFEFIPISEGDVRSKEARTYGNTIGRSGKPLAAYLPKGIANRVMHYDPEFNTFTYGDPTSKRNYLLKLQKNDLLVFYAGLTPHNNNKYKNGLYIIGYFCVDRVIDFNNQTKEVLESCCAQYQENAHIKRRCGFKDLVIVTGAKNKSKLLLKAVLISEPKVNKNGITYHAVSKKIEKLLGISGSIQRSIPPRIIKNKNNIKNLKQLLKLKAKL
jgi:hypothetical protein